MLCMLRLLEFCVEHGAYTGCEFTTDEDRQAEDLLSRLSDLKLDGTEHFGTHFNPSFFYFFLFVSTVYSIISNICYR